VAKNNDIYTTYNRTNTRQINKDVFKHKCPPMITFLNYKNGMDKQYLKINI